MNEAQPLTKAIRNLGKVLILKFLALIKSIVFHEQLFKPEVVILSDRGVELEYYKKMKFFNKHIIDKMTVYYNSIGKDFNEFVNRIRNLI